MNFDRAATGSPIRSPEKTLLFDSQFPGFLESLEVLCNRLEQQNERLVKKFEELSGNNLAPVPEAEVREMPHGYLARTHMAISALRSQVNTLDTLVEAFTNI
jgi:hypothetical protein